MKIEAKFYAKDNKLYKISDNSEVDLSSLMRAEVAMICGKELENGARSKMVSELTASRKKILCVYLPWFLVEAEPEMYNEGVLAELRDFLKELEEAEVPVIVVPQLDSDSWTVPLIENNKINSDSAQLFVAAMKHTARRIKDCATVIGFAVPKELFLDGLNENVFLESFIEELSQKHAQYVYFAKKSDLEQANLLENVKNTDLVLF